MIGDIELVKMILDQGYIWVKSANSNTYKKAKVYKIYVASQDKTYNNLFYMMETEFGDFALDEFGYWWEFNDPNDDPDDIIIDKAVVEDLFNDILKANIELTSIDLLYAKQDKVVDGKLYENPVWRLARILVGKGWCKDTPATYNFTKEVLPDGTTVMTASTSDEPITIEPITWDKNQPVCIYEEVEK